MKTRKITKSQLIIKHDLTKKKVQTPSSNQETFQVKPTKIVSKRNEDVPKWYFSSRRVNNETFSLVRSIEAFQFSHFNLINNRLASSAHALIRRSQYEN